MLVRVCRNHLIKKYLDRPYICLYDLKIINASIVEMDAREIQLKWEALKGLAQPARLKILECIRVVEKAVERNENKD